MREGCTSLTEAQYVAPYLGIIASITASATNIDSASGSSIVDSNSYEFSATLELTREPFDAVAYYNHDGRPSEGKFWLAQPCCCPARFELILPETLPDGWTTDGQYIFFPPSGTLILDRSTIPATPPGDPPNSHFESDSVGPSGAGTEAKIGLSFYYDGFDKVCFRDSEISSENFTNRKARAVFMAMTPPGDVFGPVADYVNETPFTLTATGGYIDDPNMRLADYSIPGVYSIVTLGESESAFALIYSVNIGNITINATAHGSGSRSGTYTGSSTTYSANWSADCSLLIKLGEPPPPPDP